MKLDDSYARMLERHPTMSAEEQATVAQRYARTRDPRDADRLVLGNLRLVVKIARELGAHRSDLMDLVQEGTAGLVHAVHLFDPGRGVKVTSYAAWWIRACITRHIMATSRMVSMASTREGRRRFFDRTLPGPDRSLDAPVRREDGDDSIRARVDLIADDDADRPDIRCEEHEYQQRLRDVVAAFRPTLDARERGIFEMRLLREKPARLSDVGKRFAVSGERIRQLEFRVRDDLRAFVARSMAEGQPAAA